jgi:hypothetical protein
MCVGVGKGLALCINRALESAGVVTALLLLLLLLSGCYCCMVSRVRYIKRMQWLL